MMRPTNPFNPNECPTFLPGDKVRDRRDKVGRIWRITERIAVYDYELITLRAVDNSGDEHRALDSRELLPHLEMVVQAKYK